jgi:hypothetical protein
MRNEDFDLAPHRDKCQTVKSPDICRIISLQSLILTLVNALNKLTLNRMSLLHFASRNDYIIRPFTIIVSIGCGAFER